jgi:heterodisulfide reductase subunit A-like polyferredoxin
MTLSHGYYVCFIIITIIVISREKNYVSSTAIRSSALKSVVIIGGGFGGLYTALKLNELLTTKLKEKEVCITLVDPKDKFIFLPLLYEFCIENAAIKEVGPTYQRLLENLNINFVQDAVDEWKNVDILITANPEALKNKPNGKISVKVKAPYNQNIIGDYEIDTILDFIKDENLRYKILNTKITTYEEI